MVPHDTGSPPPLSQRSSFIADTDDKSTSPIKALQISRATSRAATPQPTPEIPTTEVTSASTLTRTRSTSQGSTNTSSAEQIISVEQRLSVLSSPSSRPSSRPLTPRSSNPIAPLHPTSPNFERQPSKQRANDLSTPMESPKETTPQERERKPQRNSGSTMEPLPLPALPVDSIEPAVSKLSLSPEITPKPLMLKRSSTSASQQYAFEKAAFRNAAILCDV